jgi:hypothetical protein
MDLCEPRAGETLFLREPPIQPLQLGLDPFAARPDSGPIGSQIETILAELMRHVGLRTPLLVVSGAPGTGKSWLLNKVQQVCSTKNLSVRREDRGDLIDVVLADTCDVLLVDEADSVSPELLEQLMAASGFRKKPRTIMLMCLPGSVSRFDRVGRYPPLVQLLPLSEDEAREFLEAGAKSIGRTGLFTPEAAQLVVERAGGSPRLLRRNASLAYFAAASDRQARISAEHSAQALEANSFTPLGPNPNEGQSWTKSDPAGSSVLYRKAPASPARKLSEFALLDTSRDDQAALERLSAERNAQELERIKRREANRIFYYSWRFGR